MRTPDKEAFLLRIRGGQPETAWYRVKRQQCDLCKRMALWRHPEGGLRCSGCPKPETRPS